MRRVLLAIGALGLLAGSATAQTADEIVAKYIKTVGGAELRLRDGQVVERQRRTGCL